MSGPRTAWPVGAISSTIITRDFSVRLAALGAGEAFLVTLAESLTLGFKALSWSANKQVPEEERLSSKAIGWTMAVALIVTLAHERTQLPKPGSVAYGAKGS
jgi:hypothetical protein